MGPESSFSRMNCKAAAIPAVAGMIEPRGSILGFTGGCKVGEFAGDLKSNEFAGGCCKGGDFGGGEGGKGDVGVETVSFFAVLLPKTDPI